MLLLLILWIREKTSLEDKQKFQRFRQVFII
nr:MAG TPA: hypothetical protein [Caudoviricetes sp.]